MQIQVVSDDTFYIQHKQWIHKMCQTHYDWITFEKGRKGIKLFIKQFRNEGSESDSEIQMT